VWVSKSAVCSACGTVALVMPSLLLISVPNLSLFRLYCSMYLNLWHVHVEASQHLIDQDGFLQVLPCYFTFRKKRVPQTLPRPWFAIKPKAGSRTGHNAQSIAISREVLGSMTLRWELDCRVRVWKQYTKHRRFPIRYGNPSRSIP